MSFIGKKNLRKLFDKVLRVTNPLYLIHLDIGEPMNATRHAASCFLTFDNYSCYGCAFLLSHHPKVLDCFKCFTVEVENQKKIKYKFEKD